MTLVEYATDELKRGGWFDEDSIYDGMIGQEVVKMVENFSTGGHSGNSAALCIDLFSRVIRFRPLTPIENPMKNKEYFEPYDDDRSCLQSKRLFSLFSEDGGEHWYDIDVPVPWWKRLFGVNRSYVKFPYIPS